MHERRCQPRTKTVVDECVLTLHSGAGAGAVVARAEDESTRGLGVRVRDRQGIEVGQVVLLHRLHEPSVAVGTVRNIGSTGAGDVRLGIELHPDF
jgi:hypothetical protein